MPRPIRRVAAVAVVMLMGAAWSIVGAPPAAAQADSQCGLFHPAGPEDHFVSNKFGDPNTAPASHPYGDGGDSTLVGHWFGGSDTLAVYRATGGAHTFYLQANLNDTTASQVMDFGTGFSLPVVGDWDGDGRTDVGAFTPNGVFFLRNGDGTIEQIHFGGGASEVPIAGDWDGDGHDSIGLYRFTTGEFLLSNQHTFGYATTDAGIIRFGNPQPEDAGFPLDLPVVGDWNNDGHSTVGVVRHDGTGPLEWFLTNRFQQPGDGVADGVHPNVFAPTDQQFAFGNDAGFASQASSQTFDSGIVGDWDGNGTTTPGVAREVVVNAC